MFFLNILKAFGFLILVNLFLIPVNGFANNNLIKVNIDTVENSFVYSDELIIVASEAIENSGRPNPVMFMFKAKQKKNKKITAALLAFPFPFGIVGLHRIYLGTAPYVPVVYIGTLGGVLGILPFIDFCVIVLDKDIDRYIENKSVLMWVQETTKSTK